MPNVFRDPVGWTEKAVGTTGRFVFLCTATLGFWALALLGMHLAVRASVLYATTGQPLSMLYKGVWALVYLTTFVGFVLIPVTYLIALQNLLFSVQSKRKKDQG